MIATTRQRGVRTHESEAAWEPRKGSVLFPDYETAGFYDEMFDDCGEPRRSAELLARRLTDLAAGELPRRQKAADTALLNMGITFNVYGHEAGTEKIWPFDLIPRIMERREWRVDRGRAEAADPRPEPVHRRHVSRAEDRPRRRLSRVHGPLEQVLSQAVAPA